MSRRAESDDGQTNRRASGTGGGDSAANHRGPGPRRRASGGGEEEASKAAEITGKGGSRVGPGEVEAAEAVIRRDKVARARRAINLHQYETEDVLEQTARRIVDALTGPANPSAPKGE